MNAPAMVGMARKNENSAAARLSAPISIAPTMVAPERDTPGIMARHWKRPIFRYIGRGNRVASFCVAAGAQVVDDHQHEPAGDQGRADDERVEQDVLDEAVQKDADHRRRQEGDEDAEDEAPRVGVARAPRRRSATAA